MSKLVRGDQLPSTLQRALLAKYPYRWTSDNPERERVWRRIEGAPTMPLVSDDQWLREHAFYVTGQGTLDKRRTHAEPAFMTTDKSTIRTQATKKSPAQLDREIADVLGSGAHATKTAGPRRGVEHAPVYNHLAELLERKPSAGAELLKRERAKTAHARKVMHPPGDPKRYPGYAIASGAHGDDAYFRSKDAALRAAKKLANEKNRRVEVAHITKNQDRQIVDEIYPSRW